MYMRFRFLARSRSCAVCTLLLLDEPVQQHDFAMHDDEQCPGNAVDQARPHFPDPVAQRVDERPSDGPGKLNQ